MPLFPILEIETLVQENDKTRLDASKSFASGGSSISKIEVKPSALADTVDITDDEALDWVYPFELEIVEDVNDLVHVDEGGGTLSCQLEEGSYTLSALCAEIQTKLNAIVGSARAYVVAVSDENVITITADGLFELLAEEAASVLPELQIESAAGETAYSGDEVERISKTVTLTITQDASPTAVTKVITKTISVISERADRLFSDDDTLRSHESDILKYVVDGRASYKDYHRRAQTLIMAWLDTEGFVDDYQNKLTVNRIRDTDEVKEWATMMTLKLIFQGIYNAKDDVFLQKSREYAKQETFYRNRAVLRIDLNADGTADAVETLDIRTCRVFRR